VCGVWPPPISKEDPVLIRVHLSEIGFCFVFKNMRLLSLVSSCSHLAPCCWLLATGYPLPTLPRSLLSLFFAFCRLSHPTHCRAAASYSYSTRRALGCAATTTEAAAAVKVFPSCAASQ
jgi:hypothetical protein